MKIWNLQKCSEYVATYVKNIFLLDIFHISCKHIASMTFADRDCNIFFCLINIWWYLQILSGPTLSRDMNFFKSQILVCVLPFTLNMLQHWSIHPSVSRRCSGQLATSSLGAGVRVPPVGGWFLCSLLFLSSFYLSLILSLCFLFDVFLFLF